MSTMALYPLETSALLDTAAQWDGHAIVWMEAGRIWSAMQRTWPEGTAAPALSQHCPISSLGEHSDKADEHILAFTSEALGR